MSDKINLNESKMTDKRNIDNVKVVDFDSELAIYSSAEYVTESCDLSDCRGLIYAGDELIFKSFPFCEEYTDETVRGQNIDPTQWKIFECVEGTLIRVFFHGEKFYTCTNRRLDAFKSRWASKKTSFGESFAKALRTLSDDHQVLDDKEFLQSFYRKNLSVDKKYVFILHSSGDERIVCLNDEPAVSFIGSVDDDHVVNFEDVIELSNGTRVPKSRNLAGYSTIDELADYVFENIDYKNCQGVILFRQTTGNLESIKILSKEYLERFQIRNNTPSLPFRYLALRCYPQKLDTFFEMYPHMKNVADDIEKRIYELCRTLCEMYKKIFIQHDTSVECFREEKLALKFLHKQYISTRQPTTPYRINDLLSHESLTSKLNKLLKIAQVRQKKMQVE
jgi:hypothetical protein